AIYSGLRNRVAIPRVALERTAVGTKSGNAHPSDALPLGSYPGNSVLYAAVCGEQRVSFLQFSFEIPGTGQFETSLRDTDGHAVLSSGYVCDEREAEIHGSGSERDIYDWRKQSHGKRAESPAGLPGLPV